ncbi:MAG: FKBP-type peptidyl-prolyl cis-trans isomerase [Bacteroidales bacterium]|nr:MAG: FKBP-type peptidyl-prolyl cis-trans isomerase [Bacteroidales bacterium]
MKSVLRIIPVITGIVIILFALACGEEESAQEKEKRLLQEFIENNNISISPTVSGLYYIETETGTGNQPQSGETVAVHYTGWLMDSTMFDSSAGEAPFTFTLGVGYVIPGWDEGIVLMKRGGKASLIIPSWLAYGSEGAGSSIPPYSTLLFDVELLISDD